MAALNGKIAIITGAGTGIGRETAVRFATGGASVMLVGRRKTPLEETAGMITASGGTAAVLSADLEDGDAAAAVVTATIERFGRVDILVNNAGHSSKVRSIRHVGPQDWQSVFKVNVEGVYRITQAAIKDMLSRQEGTIITVSSMAAIAPGLLGGAPYSAAKAASLNLMRGIAAELRGNGIRTTTILPAEVDTPILDNRPLPPDSQARDTMMKAEDIADAILLCATLPQRTTIQEMVLTPTQPRDLTEDLKTASELSYSD